MVVSKFLLNATMKVDLQLQCATSACLRLYTNGSFAIELKYMSINFLMQVHSLTR